MVPKSKATPDTGDNSRFQPAANSSLATQNEHGRSLSQDTGVATRPNAGLGVSNPISRGKTTVARSCRKCREPLVGQFVRALGSTYHLDCFRCRDCKTIVASKFFPMDEQRDHNRTDQYPLCERDYFRRLDLLCEACGEALRGSYITALDKKYHVSVSLSMSNNRLNTSHARYVLQSLGPRIRTMNTTDESIAIFTTLEILQLAAKAVRTQS